MRREHRRGHEIYVVRPLCLKLEVYLSEPFCRYGLSDVAAGYPAVLTVDTAESASAEKDRPGTLLTGYARLLPHMKSGSRGARLRAFVTVSDRCSPVNTAFSRAELT